MSAIPDSGAVLALVRLLPALAAIAVAAAPPAATAPRVETVATRLEIPCEIAFLPGGRALVTERPGRMRLLDRRGRLRKAPVARVPVRAYGEGGMLGLALDLAFRANRLVYFYFTATGDGRFIAPLRVYRAPIAPSGATFVSRRGSRWTGDFLFAALRGEQLRRLVRRDGRVVRDQSLLFGRFGRLRTGVEGLHGCLYALTSNRDGRGYPTAGDDRILRVRPPGLAALPPASLNATGVRPVVASTTVSSTW